MAWLDLSHHNEVDDWDKVAKDYDGVILKATEGNGFVDPKFNEYYAEATKHGLKVKAYHFARFANEKDAQLEADFHAKVVGDKQVYNDESVLDIETNDNKLDKSTLTNCVMAFSKQLETHNLKTVVYSYPSFLRNSLEKFDLPLWLADYSNTGHYYDSLKGLYNIVMVQYTSKGHVDGIKGHVDLDKVIIHKPAVKEVKKPVNKANKSVVDYKIKAGDSLSNIATKYHTTVSKLAELNNIDNVDLIIAGQTIKVPGQHQQKHKQHVYVVRHGDTLTDIAQRFNTSVNHLVKVNHIRNRNLIYVGQIIKY